MDESEGLSDWSFWVLRGALLVFYGLEGAIVIYVRAVRYCMYVSFWSDR